jgi:hypothetical protein
MIAQKRLAQDECWCWCWCAGVDPWTPLHFGENLGSHGAKQLTARVAISWGGTTCEDTFVMHFDTLYTNAMVRYDYRASATRVGHEYEGPHLRHGSDCSLGPRLGESVSAYS